MRVFPRRRVRIEAIEDPSVAQGFGLITNLPQYKLGLRLAAQKAATNVRGVRAIDIGCGNGSLVIALAGMHASLKVVGVDLSDEMVRLARNRAMKAGLGERVTFKKGDAQRIPYPDGSFDLVVSTLSLHHWSEPRKVFDEVARILKRGGKCVLADMRRDAIPVFIGLMWFAQHFIVPPSLRRAGEPLGSIQSSYTQQEASALLRKSKLGRFCRVGKGPFWLVIKGRK
ncbi:MAG: class I SAM-dependent methyltransferase [Candidatus Atabeyarchaeum deiterrae]